MTTIAFNEEEFAFDSRVTADGIVMSDKFNKSFKVKGETFVGVGQLDQIEKVLNHIGGKEKVPEAFDFDGLIYKVVKGKGVYKLVLDEGDIFFYKCNYGNYAAGTGEHFALAWMDAGYTPKQAVEYAATRDLYTGGRVRVLKLV